MSILARLLPRADEPGYPIEPMRRKHLGQVLAIEQASYPRPWSAQVFRDELDQTRFGGRHYVVARAPRSWGPRGDVIGYAGLMFVVDEAHITNVAVHPEHRRQGVASRLLLDLADVAIERGAATWTLEVRASSRGAQELYRRFGFAPAGVRTRYYENTEDAIVMWCHDIQSTAYARRLAALRGHQ
jgi:ribosomal-protein-alanine N-acetyltransferase